jgi:RHS repeat-associated protein
MPLAVVDNVATTPVIYYVQADHLMRPARMTDASGNWVWDVIFTPFGATAYINQNPTVMDARFPGQWFQLETGLAYNWHRHYDATIGRYVQPDPLGLAALLSDGPSIYAYLGNSPLTSIDPEGLIKLPNDPSGLPPGWYQDPTHKDPNSSKWRSPGGGCLEFAPGQSGRPGWAGVPHWHDCSQDKGRRKEHLLPGEDCPQPDDAPSPPPPDPSPPPPQSSPRTVIPPWLFIIPFLPIPGNPIYGGV